MAKKVKEVNRYSWDSINGEKYWAIMDILAEEGDEITKQAELVACIEDMEVEEVLNMPLQESSKKVAALAFMNEFHLRDHYTPKSIKIEGKTYDVITDMSKLTTASFIDYQTYVKLPFREAYDKVLSCFIIPAGFTYNDGYDVMEVQKLIRTSLSWVEIQSLLNFMLVKYFKSFKRSHQYLAKEIKKEKDPMKREQLISKMQDLNLQLRLMGNQLQHMTGSV